MAEATYRFMRSQDGGSVELGIEVMEKADAYGLLAVERMLHVIGGWATWPCECGLGFHAVKVSDDGSTCRQVHIAPEDELLQAGLLAPTSSTVLAVVI